MIKILFISFLSIYCFSLLAQTDLSGTWDTDDKNTLIKIELLNGNYSGEIVSTDYDQARLGVNVLRDLKPISVKWEGEIYDPGRKKWYDAEFDIVEGELEITISFGFLWKTVHWTSYNPNLK